MRRRSRVRHAPLGRAGAAPVLAALCVVGALAVSCGTAQDTAPRGAAAPFTLPVGAPAYDPDAPAWVVGTTLQVGDQVLELDPPPTAFVVTAGGVYYLADGALWFSDGDQPERVARVGTGSLSLSPDGRHLGLMDQATGPVDPFDTRLAVPVVLDTASGEQVLRVPAVDGGADDLADEDLADLYEDAPMGFLGFDDRAAYAADPVAGGTLRLPLDGAATETLERRDPRLAGERGTYVGTLSTRDGGVRVAQRGGRSDGEGWLSPDGSALLPVGPSTGVWYSPEKGTPHRFEPGDRLFHLGGWVDDDTFYGATSTRGSYEGPAGRTLIVRCTLGRPRCQPVGTEFALPDRPSLLFPTGGSSLALH